MKSFFLVLQFFIAIALIISVLLHTAKGEGLGGIGGAARIFGTPKGMEKGLDRITWGCAIAFLVISFLLAILKG
jgi:preprotein translocase subunit SecG